MEKIPSERQIVGISIARTEERGREVVKESIRDYLGEQFETLYRESDLIFTDHYRCDGYGNYSADVTQTIDRMMREEGIPMDTTYVGKAFTGMLQYLKDNRITDQKLLFIHTVVHRYFLIDWKRGKCRMNLLILSAGTRDKVVQYFKQNMQPEDR